MESRKNLIRDILEGLNNLSEGSRVELSSFYYPTKMKVIGVSNPNIRLIIKELKADLTALSSIEKIVFAIELVDTGIFECQFIAYEIIGKDNKALNEIQLSSLNKLDRYQDNWVSVDTYSSLILGVCWRLGTVNDDYIIGKAASDNFWHRRQALVATLGWNMKSRGGVGNTAKTIMICELFIDDHQDMIVKALSWALRTLIQWDRAAVVNFMEKNEARLAARVRREVWNKINTGLKN